MIKYLIAALVCILPLSLFASDKDLYDFLWLDQDKKVFVLQNKLFEKKHTFYTDLGYTGSLSGDFQDTSGFKLYAGYYLTEEFALELVYGQYSNSENAAYKNVLLVSGIEPFIRRPVSMTSIFLNWAPFYGKINTFNKIFYFDFIMGIGSGIYKMESNLDNVDQPSVFSTYSTESYTPLHLRAEFKFHANKRIHLGAEFMSTFIQAETPKSAPSKKLQQFNEFSLKVGISF